MRKKNWKQVTIESLNWVFLENAFFIKAQFHFSSVTTFDVFSDIINENVFIFPNNLLNFHSFFELHN